MDIKSSSSKEQTQRTKQGKTMKPAAQKKRRKYTTKEERDKAHREQALRHIREKQAKIKEEKLAKRSTICRVRAILYACNHSKIGSIVHKNCPSVGPDVVTGTLSCQSATTLPHISDTRCPRCVFMSEEQGRTWQEATDYIVKRSPRCFIHELDVGEIAPASFRADFEERIVAFVTRKRLGHSNESSVLDQ